MDRVLVTGASGFIGRQLVAELLEQRCEVTCLVRPTSSIESLDGCRILRGHLEDADECRAAAREVRPDVVYHLGGLTKARKPQRLFAVNQGGTANLLAGLDDSNQAPRVVLVSSLAAAGPANQERPRKEADATAPISHYGRSKLAGEVVARSFASRLPLSIVRPPIVMGPGDRDGLEMYRAIATWGVHAIPARRSMQVSWIHVADLIEALGQVARSGERLAAEGSEGVYFAASPEHTAYADLGAAMGAALGRPAKIVTSPAAAVWAIAGAYELLGRLTSRQHIMNFDKAREATAGSWLCSGQKLVDTLGFSCRHRLVDTIEECVRWYRAAGWIPAAKK